MVFGSWRLDNYILLTCEMLVMCTRSACTVLLAVQEQLSIVSLLTDCSLCLNSELGRQHRSVAEKQYYQLVTGHEMFKEFVKKGEDMKKETVVSFCWFNMKVIIAFCNLCIDKQAFYLEETCMFQTQKVKRKEIATGNYVNFRNCLICMATEKG